MSSTSSTMSSSATTPLQGITNACGICQEECQNGEPITRLACTHMYHYDCLRPWTNLGHPCPMCQGEFVAPLLRHVRHVRPSIVLQPIIINSKDYNTPSGPVLRQIESPPPDPKLDICCCALLIGSIALPLLIKAGKYFFSSSSI